MKKVFLLLIISLLVAIFILCNRSDNIIVDYTVDKDPICKISGRHMEKVVVPFAVGHIVGESLEVTEIRKRRFPNYMNVYIGEPPNKNHKYAMVYRCEDCKTEALAFYNEQNNKKWYEFITLSQSGVPEEIIHFNDFDKLEDIKQKPVSKFSLHHSELKINPFKVYRVNNIQGGFINGVNCGIISLNNDDQLEFWYFRKRHDSANGTLIIKDSSTQRFVYFIFNGGITPFESSENIDYSTKESFLLSLESSEKISLYQKTKNKIEGQALGKLRDRP